MNIYDNNFFKKISKGSLNSALVIVPLVIEKFNPTSVIDFGCGTGAWLNVFKKFGINEVLGIDGSFFDSCSLSENEYKIFDLSNKINLNKKYSISMSLEVAEHIPEKSADLFVENLANHSDTIFWSAATPGQGGDNHINEQPHSYWIEKFYKLGYKSDENFKELFSKSSQVEFWYRKNIILFTKY